MSFRNTLRGRSATVLALGTFVALVGSNASLAAPINLSKVPLFINSQVEPNFVLSFDDSGSMELSYVPDEADDPTAPVAAFTPAFPGAVGSSINTECWWRDARWVFSAVANPMYFNPNVTYDPPKLADGTQLPDSTLANAWVDGIDNSLGTETTRLNLTTAYRVSWGASFNHPAFIVSATVTNPASTSCGSPGTTGRRNFPFGNKAFYYEFTGTDPSSSTQVYNNANYQAVDVTTLSAAQQTNFANWYSYYRTRNQTARTSLTRVFDTQQNLRVAWQNINANQLTNNAVITTIKTGSAQRTNLFNFLMRTKHNGGTPNRAATQRVGNYFGGGTNQNNDLNTTNPYYEPPVPPATTGRELSCRQNHHLLVTDGGWKDAAGINGEFDNASFTLPDGKVYSPNTAHTHVYSKQDSRTDNGLADGAFYYWSRDLRPSLTNNVPAAIEDFTLGVTGAEPPLGPGQDPRSRLEIYWNPANDPATWQHVSQYIVAFGIGGTIPFPSGLDSLRRGNATWPWWNDDNEANAQKVDDTWHATLNGRGEFFSVRDPAGLIDSLGSVFASVERRRVKNTSVSVSSGLIRPDTLKFQSTFDSSDWSGKLVATRVDNTVIWAANCTLTGGPCPDLNPDTPPTVAGIDPNSRKIATFGATGGVPFRWSSLSAGLQTSLNKHPVSGTADGLGPDRVDYIRGVRTRERSSGGPFRNRSSLLGAMVNSYGVVAVDKENYFRKLRGGSSENASFEPSSPENLNRADYNGFPNNWIYVGSNDGMLHAFDKNTGQETFAYIPGAVGNNLGKLTNDSALDYQSYVDASPTIRDAYINGAWRRILVGSLRLGGQGVFALDITNSAPANESELAAKVMWEFTDKSTGGSDLGFTFGNAEITRLANGDWVALVPGGYNSDLADGTVGSGNAVLYVLRLSNGQVIRKFDLGPASKGLMTPMPGDYTVGSAEPGFLDYTDVTDVAFAGDLNGDLWRFNFRDTNPANWSFVKFFDAPANQSITVQPRIMSTRYEQDERKFIVMFGTGKYLEPSDRVPGSGGQQALYGIFDQGKNGTYPITQAQLFRQVTTTVGSLRTATTNQLPSGLQSKGWFMNLPAAGERNITTAVFRGSDKSVIFSTLVPRSDDPCQPAVDSWVMILDGQTGGAPGTFAAGIDDDNDGYNDRTDTSLLAPGFDTNNDGVINSSDQALAVGSRFDDAVPSVTPVSLPGGGIAEILLPNGRIVIPDYQWRRRSWRELNTDE